VSGRTGDWGPDGDHTASAMPNTPQYLTRRAGVAIAADVQNRLTQRPGGQGVVSVYQLSCRG
jgi:hypothetical protein